MRSRILERDGYACVICGSTELALEVDHHQATVHGGGNDRDNLRSLCVPCHKVKTAADVTANAKVKRIQSQNKLLHRKLNKKERWLQKRGRIPPDAR